MREEHQWDTETSFQVPSFHADTEGQKEDRCLKAC